MGYALPSLSTQATTIYNQQSNTNISMQFNGTISIIINNKHSLDLLSDTDWNEISTISRIQSSSPSIATNNSHRSLMFHFPNILGCETPYDYARNHQGMTFYDAVSYCKRTRRGHLATIQSKCINTKISKECQKMGERWHCWIGLRRPFETWIDGEFVDYENWAPGEPNNAGGGEDCTEIMSETQKWNDLRCNTKRAFICEIPKGMEIGKEHCCSREDQERHRRKMERKVRKKAWAKKKAAWWRKQRALKREDEARRREREREIREKKRRYERMLRQRHRDEMRADYRRELKFERKREGAYNLLNKLIASAFGHKHMRGHTAAGQEAFEQRRRRLEKEDVLVIDMVSKCKIIEEYDGDFEFCANYNVGDKFFSFDIKLIDKKAMNALDYRMNSNDVAVDDLMYFNEYELYFNVADIVEYDGDDRIFEYVECSEYIEDLLVRMCMKQIVNEQGEIDLMLYFENYSEIHLKSLEDDVFYFNDDRIWNEINTVNGENGSQWIKKCSFKLMIAKLCIEQFHENDNRASIKLQSENN